MFILFLDNQCPFCWQTFSDACEKDEHVLGHFDHEACVNCDEDLIRIGGKLYILHDDVTCIKRTIACNSDSGKVDVVVKIETCSQADRKPNQSSSNQQNTVECMINVSPTHMTVSAEPKDIQTKPANTNRSACDICGKLVHTNSLQRHRRKMHNLSNLSEFECKICRMLFTKDCYLRQHIRRMHNSNEAEECAEPCDSEEDVKILIEPIASDPLSIVPQSPKKSIKRKRVIADNTSTKDTVQHDSDVAYKNRRRPDASKSCECDICGEVFHVNSLQRHKIARHSAPGTIVCTMCCKIFATAEALAEHTLLCISRRNKQASRTIGKFQCKICNVIVSRKYSLHKHMQLKHATSADTPSGEWKQFGNKPNQTRHSEHERDYVCDVCGQVLGNELALQRHQIVMHSEPGTIICSNCLETFESAGELTTHRQECLMRRK